MSDSDVAGLLERVEKLEAENSEIAKKCADFNALNGYLEKKVERLERRIERLKKVSEAARDVYTMAWDMHRPVKECSETLERLRKRLRELEVSLDTVSGP